MFVKGKKIIEMFKVNFSCFVTNVGLTALLQMSALLKTKQNKEKIQFN